MQNMGRSVSKIDTTAFACTLSQKYSTFIQCMAISKHIGPLHGCTLGHYMDGDFKAMHADHTKQHDDLFRALNLKKKPCKSMFEERRRVRHKYLYKRPQKDYSQCSQHFNFKSMNDALCVALQYGSNHGNNCQHNQEVIYHKRGRNYKCKNQCN
eukprot:246932_1